MRLSQIAISSGIEPTPCGFLQQRTPTGARSSCKNTPTLHDDDRWIRSLVLLNRILLPSERRLTSIAGRLWAIYMAWFHGGFFILSRSSSSRLTTLIISRWFLHSLLSHSPSAWLTVPCCPALLRRPKVVLLPPKVVHLLPKTQLLLLLLDLKGLLHRHLDLTIRYQAAQSWLSLPRPA
jgi:hypothetical protein